MSAARRLAAILGLALLVAGCAGLDAGLGGSDVPTGFDIVADGDHVKVTSRMQGLDPYPAAEAYCTRRGLRARPLQLTETRAVVACEPAG